MQYKSFILDQFQENAIKAIEGNHSVVVSAPTGSGKTLIADYIINNDLKTGVKVIYTAPIKALSNQKYKEFSSDYGKDNIGLLTGDVVINPSAPVLIMTTEIYRNMALTNDESLNDIRYVIFDEIHFINDIERGYVWEESIIFSKPHVRFLCLSATIPNAEEFAEWISSIKKHKVEVIRHDKRNVPLHRMFYDSELGITTLEEIRDVAGIPDYRYIRGRRKQRRPFVKSPSHIELIKEIKDKLPCFFFNFSRKDCQKKALELAKTHMFPINPEVSSFIRRKLSDTTPDINRLKSTQILREVLPCGVAFHHAGLLPIMKELVEELFSTGLIKVLYTTETFAVGINMPAKTVCFEALRKFDGINFRYLNSKEYFQIAGRAGRRGIDKVGYAYAMIDRREFDYKLLKKITGVDVEPIRSQFRLSINTVLNLIKQHKQEEIDEILCKNFYTFQKYGKVFGRLKNNVIYNTFSNLKKRLVRMEYVKDDKLTEKGEFASKVYADEIQLGEIFATDFCKQFNDYQLFVLLACLCYEPRRKDEFYKQYRTQHTSSLKNKLKQHEYLKREKRFRHIDDITAFVYPCYYGKNIFDIIQNTNLLEGDVFRFFRQVLDRIGQIRKATNNYDVKDMLDKWQHLINNSMQEIDVI